MRSHTLFLQLLVESVLPNEQGEMERKRERERDVKKYLMPLMEQADTSSSHLPKKEQQQPSQGFGPSPGRGRDVHVLWQIYSTAGDTTKHLRHPKTC